MAWLGRFNPLTLAIALAMTAPALGDFSASLVGAVADFVAEGGSGGLTIRLDPATGRLRHDRFTAGDPGFASDFDFDTSRLGVQSLHPGEAVLVRITAGSRLVDLVIDESTAELAGVCAVADHAVGGVFGGVRVEYDSLQRLTLRCGSAADILAVESTGGVAEGLILDAGPGDDVIVLGDAAGTLDALTAPITVLGAEGRDGLTIVDQRSDATPVEYTIDAAGVSRTLDSLSLRIDIPGGDVDDMRLLTGAGADAVAVESLAAATVDGSVVVDTGGGDDVVTIGDSAATVRGITAPLAIDGGAGMNRLIVVDSGETTTRTVTVSSTRIGAGIDDNFFPSGGWIEHANVADLEVRLGAGKDDVHVSPSATATIRLLDAAAEPGPLFDGDRIDVVAAGTVGAQIASPAPGHLRYTFDDRRDVEFIGFERMRPGGAIRGLVFLDGNGDGIRQPGEPTQPFAAVALSIAGLPATAWGRVASAEGMFEYTDLIPADFRVAVLPIPGLAPSTAPAAILLGVEQTVEDVRLGMALVAGGSVAGVVFNDADFNGSLGSGETGLGNAVVFGDLNGDRVLNANEPRVVTLPDGSFLLSFADDAAGTLLAIGPSGYVDTTPGAPFDVRSGGTVTGVRLGLALHPAPPGGNPPDGGSPPTDPMPPGDGGIGSPDDGSPTDGTPGSVDTPGGDTGGPSDGTSPPPSEDPGGAGLDDPDAIARRCAGCGNLGLLGWVSLLIPLATLRGRVRARRRRR